ncbi:hypothetical protein F4678DRAFT_463343 [Xylaria arbuscula]|nr:hypothetical protein F4678DRAFT_463343 [Xylaria arbuscula]
MSARRCHRGIPASEQSRCMPNSHEVPLGGGRRVLCGKRQAREPMLLSDPDEDGYESSDIDHIDHTVNSRKQVPSNNPQPDQQRSPLEMFSHKHIFPPFTAQDQIVHIGNGTTVAGQSTEGFLDKKHISLCYQCSKQVPLDAFLDTNSTSCGSTSCWRTEQTGLQFITMPENAAEACKDFEVFLAWWIGKVRLGADETIKNRARARVQEMRDAIP